jgi:hypothetical protein
MKDGNANQLLAKVMGWREEDVLEHSSKLQLLADYKYDHYQQFGPGRRFIESLALWLNQFGEEDRTAALNLVLDRLVFISEAEFFHLVQLAYSDVIVHERIRLVAEEQGLPMHRVGHISRHPRFNELRLKSLYLGLSDGARTSELRRANNREIGNEQISQAYELGHDKAQDMIKQLRNSLKKSGLAHENAAFNLIWLLDDFSGSGNTYIRLDAESGKFKGKIKKVYELLHQESLIDPAHYEVFVLLYVATRQAIDHIEYWAERFTSQMGYKPLQLKVLSVIERDVALTYRASSSLMGLLHHPRYYDAQAFDEHMAVGSTEDARLGFAACALPVVLAHNTPNNSVYLLWGPESFDFFGLFPRVSRHREF